MIEMSVVLPEPDGPSSATNSPWSTAMVASDTAVTAVWPSPYTLLTPDTRSRADGWCVASSAGDSPGPLGTEPVARTTGSSCRVRRGGVAHSAPPMAVAGSMRAMRRSENSAPTTPATTVKTAMVTRVSVRNRVGHLGGDHETEQPGEDRAEHHARGPTR